MTIVITLFSALIVLAASVAIAAFTPDIADALRTSKEIYVATRRADGSTSKVVPVWFMFDGEAVYFATSPTSHKAKRIKKGSPLLVWVGRADGPHFVGKAELSTDPDLAARMAPVYSQK
jgi:general stress protein 26